MSAIITELDIARGVASSELPSPTQFANSKYFRMRVSGCGVAYRKKYGEYTYRPASVWCSPSMIARVAGLPVIEGHPPDAVLDGPQFYQRIVGICVLGFVENNELWSVVRIISDRAASILMGGFYDTSPSCTFSDQQNTVIEVDGEPLLIESEPSFLDHCALVDTSNGNAGVWGIAKAGSEIGVQISEKEQVNG